MFGGDHLRNTLFAFAIVGPVLSIGATVLRFEATRRARRKPSWEDWFAALSTFFLILYATGVLYFSFTLGSRGARELTIEELKKLRLASYAYDPQYSMQQLFAKFSLLFLYYRIFSINRSFVICVYCFGIFDLLWAISTYLVHFFECRPIRKYWYPLTPGWCINDAAYLVGLETPNSLMDFAMVGLAIWMIQSLNMKIETKIKLSILFVLGGLSGIIGFVKIGEAYAPQNKTDTEAILRDPIWALVQQTCSVICCCAPIYKPLLPENGILQRLRSYSSQVFGRSRDTRGDSHNQEQHSINLSGLKGSDQWVQIEEARVSGGQVPLSCD